MDYKQAKAAFEDAGFVTVEYTSEKVYPCLGVICGGNYASVLLTTLDRYAEHKGRVFTGADDAVGCIHDLIQDLLEVRVDNNHVPSVMYFRYLQNDGE